MKFTWENDGWVEGEKPRYSWKADVWFYVGLLAVAALGWWVLFSKMVCNGVLSWFHII